MAKSCTIKVSIEALNVIYTTKQIDLVFQTDGMFTLQ